MFLLLASILPSLKNDEGCQRKPDASCGVEVISPFVYQAGTPIIGGVVGAPKMGNWTFFTNQDRPFGRVGPGQGDFGLLISRLADQIVAVVLVVTPFSFAGFCVGDLFAQALQAVKVVVSSLTTTLVGPFLGSLPHSPLCLEDNDWLTC